MLKLYKIQISVPINKVFLEHCRIHFHIVRCCFVLQWQSWVAEKETLSPAKANIFIVWLFTEKVNRPVVYMIVLHKKKG